MKKHLTIATIILSVAALILCQAALAADPLKDAKDAYAKFVKAAKAKKVDEAKKLIAKDALKDIEKDNMLEFFIDMHADIKPETIKAAKTEVQGSMVVLNIEQVEQSKEGKLTTNVTVYMVKEDGQWKVGKPEGAK